MEGATVFGEDCMSEIICNHCGNSFDEAINYCPSCRKPTPSQQERDLSAIKRKFIIGIVGLAIFCMVMIVWLPRGT